MLNCNIFKSLERNTAHSLKQFPENYYEGQFTKDMSTEATARATSSGWRGQN